MLSILVSIPLMLVCLRVLGETNWGPGGPVSNLVQALFAGLAPGNAVVNVMAGGTTGTVAIASEGLMQDYKAGHVVGARPRTMTFAQLLGAPIGAAALAFIYPVLVHTYGIVGEGAQLAAPAARRTATFAEVLATGLGGLPRSAVSAMLVAAAVGALLAAIEEVPRLRRFAPSPTGLGLGMILPFSIVATLFAGGVAQAVWRRLSPGTEKPYLAPLASGFIAGEALAAILVPLLLWAGLGRS